MTATQGLEPTQTRRPWRSTIRTALQVGIPAILLLPTIVTAVIEELGPNLPPSITAWLVGAGAFVTAFAALTARLMAIPQVELWLRMLPGAAFAAQPRPKPEPEHGGPGMDAPEFGGGRGERGAITRDAVRDAGLLLIGVLAIAIAVLGSTGKIGG